MNNWISVYCHRDECDLLKAPQYGCLWCNWLLYHLNHWLSGCRSKTAQLCLCYWWVLLVQSVIAKSFFQTMTTLHLTPRRLVLSIPFTVTYMHLEEKRYVFCDASYDHAFFRWCISISQQVWFLEEEKLPLVSSSVAEDGKHKILMKSPWEFLQRPIGSAGVISLLSSQDSLLDELGELGVEYVQVSAYLSSASQAFSLWTSPPMIEECPCIIFCRSARSTKNTRATTP